MSAGAYRRWTADGWRGWLAADVAADAPLAWLAAAERAPGRTSRHARSARLDAPGGALFVKLYPPPDGWRAWRAFRMGRALTGAGFGAPEAVVTASRGGGGLFVTRALHGQDLVATLTAPRPRREKRALLGALGAIVGRLHGAGFVHGDLVPPNLWLDAGGRFVFLDNDRTRQSRLLVALGGRRNLVQLGRFVVPGVTMTDRARVLSAYAAVRGLSTRARRRLARWVVVKTVARRCAIDRIPRATAMHAGFRELMRSGGPFDPAASVREAR
jgi:hypothetical protein